MKVLVLCLSDGHGGLELYAAQEVNQLQQKGHMCLPVVRANSMLDKKLCDDGHTPAYLQIVNRRLPILAARRLARMIDDNEIDLIHLHWNDDLNLAALAKRFSRRLVRIVYSRHMAITRSKKDPLHRWFYSHVDRMVVLTGLMQQEAQKYLPIPSAHISQLYLGVADNRDEPAECDDCYSDDFPRRRFNLALFGRIEPYKGQHLLLEAIEKLVADGLDVSGTIIGHVMYENYFQTLKKRAAADSLRGHIHFESFVKNPARRMKCYDSVVLTTYCESFGLVLIEAMRAGVMVIGTNAGGVKEIIEPGETGLLFEPGDADGLAAAIRKVYGDETLLNNLAANGQHKADASFSDAVHFEKLEKILSAEVQLA